MALLEVKNVKKIYTTRFGGNQVEALKNVNFSVEPREYVAIMGESGSGKTTLLNILAALDKPSGGKVYLKAEILEVSERKKLQHSDVKIWGSCFRTFIFWIRFLSKIISFCLWYFPAKSTKRWKSD